MLNIFAATQACEEVSWAGAFLVLFFFLGLAAIIWAMNR